MSDNKSAVDKQQTNYGDSGFSTFLRRAFLSSAGFDDEDLDRPIIGIAVTQSSFNTCHRDMPNLLEAVRRGVLEAGGLPMEFPTISLGEILTSPTAMLYRNLMAMDTEEMIQALPMDGAVLLGGCDKTVPAQLMAAASSDKPVLLEVVGPMMTGKWEGERLGACTDCRRLWGRHRAGELDTVRTLQARSKLVTTAGTCTVMGTASTMAAMAEVLGMLLPGGATPPAVHADRLRHATATGRRIVEMVKSGGPLPREVLTRDAFENAIKTLAAIGGSTNAIIHLLAVARRAGVDLDMETFDALGQQVPLLVDCKPSGQFYLPDLHDAGGVPVVLKTLEPLLNTKALTAAGTTLEESLTNVVTGQPWQTIVRSLEEPLGSPGALAVVRGNLAPNGAIIKASAADPRLMTHTGPALVVDADADIAAILDDPDLEVTPDHVLVLRYAGPIAAGMPEAGSLPIPAKLARQGVKDMVRVSDARMSGTSYGTVVLHCDPEAASGGPLALVENGDLIKLDVPNRTIDLLISDEEMERRRAEWAPRPIPKRGWRHLYAANVLPASQGADLSFL